MRPPDAIIGRKRARARRNGRGRNPTFAGGEGRNDRTFEAKDAFVVHIVVRTPTPVARRPEDELPRRDIEVAVVRRGGKTA